MAMLQALQVSARGEPRGGGDEVPETRHHRGRGGGGGRGEETREAARGSDAARRPREARRIEEANAASPHARRSRRACGGAEGCLTVEDGRRRDEVPFDEKRRDGY